MVKFSSLPWLDYDDVLLRPQYSEILSRSKIDTSTVISINSENKELPQIKIKVPVISANMDTITGELMANTMAEHGAAGILHRYQDPCDVIKTIKSLRAAATFPIIPSVGAKAEDIDVALSYIKEGADAICVDIAHGGSEVATRFINTLRCINSRIHIIAGNVATWETAYRLHVAGATAVKVGISNGSVCSTRPTTGVGVPSFTALLDVCNQEDDKTFKLRCPVIADGGFTKSGDIVKALAAGASAIMSGYFFAGTDEAAQPTTYRGMSSNGAQAQWKGWAKHVEGREIKVESKGPVFKILEQLTDGITSGMSYCNAKTIVELWEKAEFITRR